MRGILIFIGTLLFDSLTVTPADAATPCQVHVILFVPADSQPPAEYQQRIDEIVACAESFFQREFKRWGHEKVVMPFHRTRDGHVEVTTMRGKEQNSAYKPVTLRAEVMDALRRQKKLDGGRQIWWIMVYAGEPPAKFAGFLGGYGVQIGGWSVCNFDTTPGRIDPEAPLGSPFLKKLMLKGMLHELGHGFGLPHIGPLLRDKAGNTLMGPTHTNYQRVARIDEPHVYLSEAEAAILSTHPAFRGVPDDREHLPKVNVQGLKYAANSGDKTLRVSGRVRAPRRAAFAIVADESQAQPGEYWTKTYVGKVAPDGTFEVTISEPTPANGTLTTWFVLENGAHTDDARLQRRLGKITQQYTYSQRQWTFP